MKMAELFCGGGLMAVGLKEAGFNLVWANDFDKNAVKAYRHNLGDHVVHGDITEINPDDIPDVDVIAGGPPCQDYSFAGKGVGIHGERGKLIFKYFDIIEAKKPKAFIFENVKGLIGKRHRPVFEALVDQLDAIGYRVSWKLINAWDYGVAQKRERVFIVGIRKDLGITYQFPEPDPADYRTKVLRDAIGDLPEPGDQVNGGRSKAKFRGDGTQGDKLVKPWNPSPTIRSEHHGNIEGFDPALMNHIQTRSTTVKPSSYNQRNYKADWNKPARTVNTSRLDHAEIHPGPANHTGYGLRNDEKPWAHKIPPGGNWRSLSEEEQLESWNGRIPKGGGCTNRLRKRDWNEPAGTVTTTPMQKLSCQLHPGVPANHEPKPLSERVQAKMDAGGYDRYLKKHPPATMDKPSPTVSAQWHKGAPNGMVEKTKPRRFTVRECLRIQSVPDWYVFPDDMSLSAQYRIVGNGVASRVAWYLGKALKEQISVSLSE